MHRVVVPWTVPVGPEGISYEHVVDLDLGDPIGAQIESGTWQLSDALLWLLSVIRPGDAVLDLGAHIGTFAIPAAVLGARVAAVEGSPRNAEVLRAACEQNRLDNVTVVEAVVDRGVGQVDFVDLGPYGTISTVGIGAATGYPTIRSSTIPVDDLADGPFAWAKVDIEGKEQAILAGATRTLQGLRGMVFESNGYMLHSHGTTPGRTVETLEAAGMSVFEVSGRNLRPLRRPFIQPETILDYVAVKGRPPLPPGWGIAAARDDSELVDALVAEARHPIAVHREHAERTIAELPRRTARLLRRRS